MVEESVTRFILDVRMGLMTNAVCVCVCVCMCVCVCVCVCEGVRTATCKGYC